MAAVPVGGGRAWSRQISHIISHGHFSRPYENVAIPMMHIQCLNKPQGNYVQNCEIASGPGRGADFGRLAWPAQVGEAAAHRHTQRPGPPAPGTPAGPHSTTTTSHPQRNEAATGCPATASSRSRSAAQQSGTAQVSAVHNSATSDQAVMST